MEKDRRNKEEGMPIVVMKNSKDKWTSSFIVPQKGVCDYAVGAISREIQNAGYNRVIFKSGQELALKELLRAVKRERAEKIEFAGIGKEESAVGESASNGFIERAIQDVQGQIRTIKLAVEWRYKSILKEDHPILPWIVKYAGITISVCRKGEDGRTAYERRRKKIHKGTSRVWGMCVVFKTRVGQGE